MSALNEQLRLLKLGSDESQRETQFPVRPRLLRAKQSMKGQARKLIRADLADDLVKALPIMPEESTHALLSGEFILGDLIGRIREYHGEPRTLWIATLSIGMPNVETLKAALHAGVVINLFVSHYFQSTDKELYGLLERELMPLAGFHLYVARLHTKVLLFDYPSWKLTLTTSANLRSSNNLEQLDAFAAPPLFFFHEGWMQEIIERAEKGVNPGFAVRLNAGGNP